MKRMAIYLVFLAAMLNAQQRGQPVNVIPYPIDTPTIASSYDGSGNLIYACYANPQPPTSASDIAKYQYSLSVTGTTLTSIVVLTNVGTVTTAAAHGLMVGQLVTVTGSTTSALNATYSIATVPSTTTFTIATSGVGNATYNNGPLTIAGTAPLLTSPIWFIQKLNYDSSNRLVNVMRSVNGNSTYGSVCANAAVVSPTAGFTSYR